MLLSAVKCNLFFCENTLAFLGYDEDQQMSKNMKVVIFNELSSFFNTALLKVVKSVNPTECECGSFYLF